MNHRTRATRFVMALLIGMALLGPVLCASDGLELLQEIKDGDPGIEIKDHVTSIVPVGDFVYFGIEYQGVIKCFKRDAATGKLTFVADTKWGDAHDSMELCLAGGRLYGVGGAGHRTGDGDSRGLHWFEIDLKTGALTEKTKLPVPISKGIVAAPDGKSLYLLYKLKATIAHFSVGADGTPAHAEDAVFKDANGELSGLTAAPDGTSLYVLWANKTNFVGVAQAGATGALTVQPTVELPQLTAGVDWPASKWGWGWGRGIFFAPDGKQACVEFSNYGSKNLHVALCTRDPKTGALAYQQRIDDKTGPAMVRMLGMAFEPDGTKGYYISGSESAGNAVGSFTRDPKTGLLTGGVEAVATKGSGPCCMALDAKNHLLYVGGWAKKVIYVFKTGT